ncbi:uncharacterized protein TrAtP1_000306 [Trichoderma atroviride]|uniref:uncharacterized protein n=1 Tax=Hypocrea atroviridis TaxID=63577 RepID=UPI00332D212F|nr:hypothetical protein TrAtP1_000306 [Trichoderma atroviride]
MAVTESDGFKRFKTSTCCPSQSKEPLTGKMKIAQHLVPLRTLQLLMFPHSKLETLAYVASVCKTEPFSDRSSDTHTRSTKRAPRKSNRRSPSHANGRERENSSRRIRTPTNSPTQILRFKSSFVCFVRGNPYILGLDLTSASSALL